MGAGILCFYACHLITLLIGWGGVRGVSLTIGNKKSKVMNRKIYTHFEYLVEALEKHVGKEISLPVARKETSEPYTLNFILKKMVFGNERLRESDNTIVQNIVNHYYLEFEFPNYIFRLERNKMLLHMNRLEEILKFNGAQKNKYHIDQDYSWKIVLSNETTWNRLGGHVIKAIDKARNEYESYLEEMIEGHSKYIKA
jgi:hypothetical protein